MYSLLNALHCAHNDKYKFTMGSCRPDYTLGIIRMLFYSYRIRCSFYYSLSDALEEHVTVVSSTGEFNTVKSGTVFIKRRNAVGVTAVKAHVNFYYY